MFDEPIFDDIHNVFSKVAILHKRGVPLTKAVRKHLSEFEKVTEGMTSSRKAELFNYHGVLMKDGRPLTSDNVATRLRAAGMKR